MEMIFTIGILILGAAVLGLLLFTGGKGRQHGIPADFETDPQPAPLASKTWAAHCAAADLDLAVMTGTPQEILNALDDAAAAAQELAIHIQTLKDRKHDRKEA